MKKLLLLLTVTLIIGCNDSPKKTVTKKEDKQRYFSLERVAELKKRCVENGDTEAFGNLVDHYGNTPFENYELLPVSIIMADKYNCDNARVAIYFCFLEMQNKGRDEKQFFKLDKSKQDFILKYLMDGAKNKNPGCLGILNRLLENGLKMERNKEKEIEELYKKTTANKGFMRLGF
ncbi:hypothetical protein FLJC2902T_31590 [Flavobacterium limnosediminis JC2902]|uniref:Lipoprotein n=1 Tax=Flavobacterium limnosediminis JC2902 TaxID=1341181 RepID=V6SFJ9_9FLAO|nr:hypothetical protein [Flavobacterium limnosediminis]ESU25219.1 hypothetical protein FLJC2902T_31590 [Flavobacterium limnosediminis JC2902]